MSEACTADGDLALASLTAVALSTSPAAVDIRQLKGPWYCRYFVVHISEGWCGQALWILKPPSITCSFSTVGVTKQMACIVIARQVDFKFAWTFVSHLKTRNPHRKYNFITFNGANVEFSFFYQKLYKFHYWGLVIKPFLKWSIPATIIISTV